MSENKQQGIFDKKRLDQLSEKQHAITILAVAVFMAAIFSYYYFKNTLNAEFGFFYVAFFIGVITASIAALSKLDFPSFEAKKINKLDVFSPPNNKNYLDLKIPQKVIIKEESKEELKKEEKKPSEKMELKSLWIDRVTLIEFKRSLRLSIYINAAVGGILSVISVFFFSGFNYFGSKVAAVFPAYTSTSFSPSTGNEIQAIFWCFLFAWSTKCFKNTLNRAEDEVLDIYYSGLDEKPTK